MARIDGTSRYRVDEFTIRAYRLEDCLKLRLHEVSSKFADRFVYLSVQDFVVDRFPDTCGRIDQDHTKGMSFGYETFPEFRFQQSRCIFIMKNLLEQFNRFFCITLITRSDRVLSHGNGSKCFREYISSFAYRNTGCRYFVEHASVGVETVFLDEIDPVFTCLQPFFAFLYIIVGICQYKSEPSLKPDRLV